MPRLSIEDFHVIKLKKSPESGRNMLIISHKDLDGVLSTIIFLKGIEHEYDNIDLVFTQPYLNDELRTYMARKNLSSKYTDFALLDLAVDSMKPGATGDFILSLGNKLKYIFDHHNGWEVFYTKREALRILAKDVNINAKGLTSGQGRTQVYIRDYKSCGEVVFEYFKFQDNTYAKDLMELAKVADDILYRSTLEYNNYYKSLYARLRGCSLDKLVAELASINDIKDLTEADKVKKRYLRNRDYALELLKTAEDKYPGIGYIRLFDDNNVNYTILFEEAYKKYKIFIIKELNAKDLKISYSIAHCLPDLNLCTVFNKNSGSPKRITITRRAVTIDKIVDLLKQYV